jgi:hypothetical protein
MSTFAVSLAISVAAGIWEMTEQLIKRERYMSPSRDGLPIAGWRKAQRSIGNGECVEVAPLVEDMAVRDSMDPGGTVLRYSARSWRLFVTAAKEGNFDSFRG